MICASSKARLGELLVRRRLINPLQLEQALSLQQQSGQKLGQVIVQQGWITHTQLEQILTQQRWQRVMASVLVTCSTLFSSLPKVVSAQPVARIANVNLKSQAESEGSGSRQAVVASNGQRPALQSPQEVDAMPLASNPTESAPLTGFCNPLRGYGVLSQGFHGVTHQGRMAYARDYQVSLGTPVYAMRSGRVIGAEDRFEDIGGGAEKVYEFNYVLIEHQGGYRSAYLHLHQGFLAKAGIKAGDYVTAGQLIGYSGNSGWSSGPHLHVEMQEKSDPGTFGDSVPFKIGRSCEPSVMAVDPGTKPVSVGSAQGAGDIYHTLKATSALR